MDQWIEQCPERNPYKHCHMTSANAQEYPMVKDSLLHKPN